MDDGKIEHAFARAKYEGCRGGINMETHDSDMVMVETFPPKSLLDFMRATDRRLIVLRQQTIQDLETLQEIIRLEEEQVLNLDETLARVLEFYRRFIPYKEHEEKRRITTNTL